MKEKGAKPDDLKQQETVLAESRLMIPDCRKKLEAALADLKVTLVAVKESSQQGTEIEEAESTISALETSCYRRLGGYSISISNASRCFTLWNLLLYAHYITQMRLPAAITELLCFMLLNHKKKNSCY
ncbi:Tubulin-specific chaperone A [Apostasia shenzhenica]|uniref:Tubulin-specific chaperone A n=1 Tax=Apostasia shenzhenica TaxID=1088818 RepID=A0A2I0ACG2_9ASPA|nr:Tubulin-specific chaperone A [Apostasia shenzhenica]